MGTIAWNPLGCHLLDAHPKGGIFNAEYYRDNILPALIQVFPERGGRQFAVQADNARPYTAGKSRVFVQKMGYG
jgi:hypothetical protein